MSNRNLHTAVKLRFKSWYLLQMFFPKFLSMCFNPVFFTRRGLFNQIQHYSHHISRNVLDFGCGAKPYMGLFKYEKYTGLDIKRNNSEDGLNKADVFYDGVTIPFPDGGFDSIFSSQVFEHIYNLEQIVSELNRVLKVGGKMLVTVPFVFEEHERPFDFKRYSSFGLRTLLEENGFMVLEMKRDTTYFETILQVFLVYLTQNVLPQNRYFRFFLLPFILFPIIATGRFVSKIMPDNGFFFCNNVVLAQKVKAS